MRHERARLAPDRSGFARGSLECPLVRFTEAEMRDDDLRPNWYLPDDEDDVDRPNWYLPDDEDDVDNDSGQGEQPNGPVPA